MAQIKTRKSQRGDARGIRAAPVLQRINYGFEELPPLSFATLSHWWVLPDLSTASQTY
jgi:hypothetical protein